MGKRSRQKRERKDRDEVARLRAVVHAIHDDLHHGRVEEAHKRAHCGEAVDLDEPLPGQNVTARDASEVATFMAEFNELAREYGVMACTVVAVKSATVPGAYSFQIGGHVATIQYVRHQMGLPPTTTPHHL